MKKTWREYTTTDFESLGFHDCHVHGIGWDLACFRFEVDLDYIVEWVSPIEGDDRFGFRISRGLLAFDNVDQLQVRLDWDNVPLDCQIQELKREGQRITPNGTTQWRWVLDFQWSLGEIALWATGFSLALLSEPSLSKVQTLRGGESTEGAQGSQ